jgi:hypothetical protein
MTPTDRIRIQRAFAESLSTLGCIAVWYSGQSARIFVRSHPFDPATIHANQRGRRAIPIDAIRVGDYAEPFASSAFLDDLEESIRRASLTRD